MLILFIFDSYLETSLTNKYRRLLKQKQEKTKKETKKKQ